MPAAVATHAQGLELTAMRDSVEELTDALAKAQAEMSKEEQAFLQWRRGIAATVALEKSRGLRKRRS